MEENHKQVPESRVNTSLPYEGQGGGSAVSAISLIKAELRSAMNGITSRAIRESGMTYKLSFGVELPRLRQIAAEFTPDRRLAQDLWQENIRECKMLAIMLYPIEEFDADRASLWIEGLTPEQSELAQLMSMDLLSRMPDASEMAFHWMADDREMFQLCGFLVITRLLMRGAILSPDAEAEFLDQAAVTLPSSFLALRKAVTNALLRFGETSKEAERAVEKILSLP